MTRFHYEEIQVNGYERVVYAEDSSAGLKSFIAIHNTNRGPACGGIRLLPYASKDEALNDVLRLAKGMSYKSALAGIGFGGGKSVIIADPKDKGPALFHAFGEFVARFEGRYIAAKDMNIDSADLLEIRKRTSHVVGIEGVPGSSGDPSPVTARGILRAIEATAEELSGTKDLNGMRVAIQGIGHVGYSIAESVAKEGGKLWVTDVDPKALKRAETELGATVVKLDDIYDIECDIFSPCARGAIINEATIKRLRCRAVVGCANNQLAEEKDGKRLQDRGILYAPDFAVNSGGIINIFIEFEGYDRNKALAKADAIYPTLKEIYRRAKTDRVPPFVLAEKLAEERLYEKLGGA
jgi:leucine dehydrogenase